jgi:FAD/FMN-containing dehydrogenase
MITFSIQSLREQVRGEVVGPEDGGYEQARKVFNAMIDRRPAVIVRAANAGDVMSAVNFARENDLAVAVRGGGHSVPGFGTWDDAVVIDLQRMRSVHVDPRSKTARAEGGATWGDYNAATHAFGLASTGGIISTTGVGGLTLGGGIGYLTRGCGLSLDNLLSADVVTADGEFRTASERDNEDLFWAIRGGGGNFGVVTSFEFKLFEVKDIYGGPMFYDLKDAKALLELYRDHIKTADERLGGFPAFQIAPPLPFIPENRHFQRHALFVACWSGPIEEGEKQLKPFHDVAAVVAEHVGPAPYPALNAAFDGLYPAGELQHYWKANFVKELTDEAIAVHLEHGAQVPALESTVHIYPINGAPQRVPQDVTAFGHRDASFATVIAGMWRDPADNAKNTKWVRDYSDAITPYSEAGGYVNFMSEDDQGRAQANYGANYNRLVEVKRRYDPDNLFRANHNIKP